MSMTSALWCLVYLRHWVVFMLHLCSLFPQIMKFSLYVRSWLSGLGHFMMLELHVIILFVLHQVGQLDCKDRQQFLEDRYSFSCKCSGCLQLNLSDLVLNSYRCVKMNCYGVVLDNHVVEYEKQKFHCFLGPSGMINSNFKVFFIFCSKTGFPLEGQLGNIWSLFQEYKFCWS